MESPLRVIVVEPERLPLAGHMVAGLLRRGAADERRAARAARLRGNVAVDAGGMHLCLEFAGGEVRVRAGDCPRPRAALTAGLGTLLDVALGRGFLRPFLRGEVRTRGNPFLLLRLLGLMRVR